MNEKDEKRIDEIVRLAAAEAIAPMVKEIVSSVIRSIKGAIIIFLFIMSGSFGFTMLVRGDVRNTDAKCQEAQKTVDQMRQDVGTISGKLSEEYPESIILNDIRKRNIQSRGNAETN